MDATKVMEDHIPQHLNSPKTTAIVTSFINEFTDEQLHFEDIKNAIFIDTAQGEELNSIGTFFRMARNENETDSAYRTRIKKARDKANVCGVRSLMQTYLQELLGSTYATVTESSSNPLILTAKIPLGTEYTLATIQELLESIKMAGVKIFYTTDVAGTEISLLYDNVKLIDLNTRFKADINKPESGVYLS